MRILFSLICALAFCTLNAQTNVTSLVKNFSFENGLTNWINDGFQTQENTAFTLKSGTWYAEKWVPEDGTLPNASLVQTIQGLTAGTYTLKVRAQHIQQANTALTCTGASVFIGDKQTTVNKAQIYTVEFTAVCSKTDIGIRVVNASGNWVSCDHFQLTYKFDKDAVATALQQLVSDAEGLKNNASIDGGQAQVDLIAKIENAKTLIGSEDADAITKAADELSDAMWTFRLATATEDHPIDFTSYITNPSFELGLTGWTNNGFHTQGNNAFSGKVGTTYAERWVPVGKKIGTAALTQALSGMPKGRYIIKANAQNILEGNGALQNGFTLTAEAGSAVVTKAGLYEFAFTSIENTLTIGVTSDNATGNWLAVDNFRLLFAGNGGTTIQDEMDRRIAQGKDLMQKRMNATTLATLKSYISRAEKSTEATFANNAALLRIANAAAIKSSESYATLLQTITTATDYLAQGWTNGTQDMEDAIALAQSVYDNNNSSNEQLAEQTKKLEGAMLALKLANGTGTPPVISTDYRYARGNNRIFARMGVSGSNIIEEGFCYSKSSVPTVADDRTTRWIDSGGRIYVIEDLEPGTTYYIRGYAITSTNNVGYGDVIKAITIPKAVISWSYEYNGTPEENARIEAGMNGWYEYWSQLTSMKGFYPSVRMAYGTPTADCSYGGWVRVGPNTNFQSQTMLTHELLHGIGVGTHNIWWGAGGMRANGDRGVWLGDRVTSVLTFWHNAHTVLDGDNTHMWPWGFNYSSEDPHTEAGYTINALVAQALGEDGLPPTGGFATPYYAFEHTDNRKYYLTNEETNHGLGTGFLAVAPNGTLSWRTIAANEALENDSVAWYIGFDPATQFYSFRNAATGKYIVYDAAFKLHKANAAPANGFFQMMTGRTNATIVNANGNITRRGYWIVHNENIYTSPCLAAIDNGAVRSEGFDLGNWALTQRWLILSTSDLIHLSPAKEENHTVLSQLKVNNEPIPEFQSERYNYDYEISPSSTLTRYSMGFTKATGFKGKVTTSRPKSIPGTGTVVATATDGTVTTYTVNFFHNHAISWDGDGAAGLASEPTRYGWGPKIGAEWSMANSHYRNVYLDPYEGAHVGYTISDGQFKYDYQRILQLGFTEGTEEYTYTLATLQPDSTYSVRCQLALAEAERLPELTIGVRHTKTGATLAETTVTPSIIRKQLQSAELEFKTPADATDETDYTIYFRSDKGQLILTLADFVVTPADEATAINGVENDNQTFEVWVDGNNLSLHTSTSTPVTIYSINGVLLHNIMMKAGETKTITLPKGIYLINGVKIYV